MSLHIDRRGLIERALLLVGATAGGAFSPAALARAAARPGRYLSPALYALLSAVADTIVPRTTTAGALDAKVPASIDAMLANWASGPHKVDMTGALARIERRARDTQGKGFAELPADARLSLLGAFDVEALKPVPRTDGLKDMAAMMAGPSVVDTGYGKLKELIVLLYYFSEPALTQELSYVHAPGEWKPSIPVTAETRPAGGTLF